VVAVAGAVLIVVAYGSSHGTRDPLVQQDAVILALLGVSLAVIGSAVWFRHSLTRYFRYWLTRLVHEQRAQTDRVVDALSRPPPPGDPRP
jgi:multisubunit Na+/H+ antiporter MnhB subunit